VELEAMAESLAPRLFAYALARTLRDVDTRVRGALRTDGVTARRIVMRALAEDHGPSTWMRRVPYTVAAATVVVIVLVISAWQWRRTARVEERQPFSRAATARLPASSASRGMNASPSVRSPVPPSLAITGRGSLLIVDSQDGRRWVVGPLPERRAGGNYVIVFPQ